MPTVLLLCSILLVSLTSVTNAANCLSTDCPGSSDSVCVIDCSEVAVEQFNQPESHGNCGLFYELGINSTNSTSNTTKRQGCFINECPFTECIAVTRENANTIDCCCTEDLCNHEFTTPSPTPTPPVVDPVDVSHLYFDDFPHHTNNTGMYVCLSVVPGVHKGRTSVFCLCVCVCIVLYMHMCVCVRACMRACVRACMRVHMCECDAGWRNFVYIIPVYPAV